MGKEGAVEILLIEDNLADAFLFKETLTGTSKNLFNVTEVKSVEAAFSKYKDKDFNLIILDMNLPGLSGVDALKKLQADDPSLPIIIMTGVDDEEIALEAVKQGAQDYLVKGKNDSDIIKRSIRYAIERKSFENKLIKAANYDVLTGLVNRDLFRGRIDNSISLAKKTGGKMAVFLLGLDNFKDVNDTLGHEIGDQTLKGVANRLLKNLRGYDGIARVGSDEFAFIVDGKHANDRDLQAVSKRIIDLFNEPVILAKNKVHITTSVGVATYPESGGDEETLMKSADIAIRKAKDKGGNRYYFFTQKLNDEVHERVKIENALRHALENEEFILHYQPLVDIKQKKITGVEALIRWQSPEMGLVPPFKFIPVAEKSDLIVSIGEWVVKQACVDLKKWKNIDSEAFYISVNLSAKQFNDDNLVYKFSNILKENEVNPKNMALEITESITMRNPEKAHKILSQFKEMGIKVFIDDFGTGYSSLSHLSKFPLDVLKIDRSFVQDITSNPSNQVIVKSIMNIAKGLNLDVISEGVEEREQIEFLKSFGCRNMQGYFFSKPIPQGDFYSLYQDFKF